MQPLDLHQLKTEDLHTRPSKVMLADLGRPAAYHAALGAWFESLPRQLAANEIRRLRDEICRCHLEQRTLVVAIGGHVIKTGCAPYLIDWIDRGLIRGLAMNGSAAIHDYELALAGKTSEDVASQLARGAFGMARQTAQAFATASQNGAQTSAGLGRALGALIAEQNCPHADASLVYAAYRNNIPCTIHVALGTDIVHMHPGISGAALGESSLLDFRILCQLVMTMAEGLWLNIGSAVVMPEVFLKAIAVARNFGADLAGLVTANLDKEAKYRTRMNVLSRPSAAGLEIIGHHEILIPLLHMAVMSQLSTIRTEQQAA